MLFDRKSLGVLILSRDLALCSTFVALAVALGFALVHIPNVELMTLIVFFSGYLQGPRRGGLIGFIAMSIFTTFNPMGVPFAPVALAQIAGMAIIGFAAGLTKKWLGRGPVWIKLGVLGLACTLFYDLTTNAAMAFSSGMLSRLFAVLIAGLTFSILHMVSNMLIFAVAGPFLTKIMPPWVSDQPL